MYVYVMKVQKVNKSRFGRNADGCGCGKSHAPGYRAGSSSYYFFILSAIAARIPHGTTLGVRNDDR